MLNGILRIFASVFKKGNAVPKSKPDGTFDASWGLTGGGGAFADIIQENFVLNATNIANKKVTLTNAPFNSVAVELKIAGGAPQILEIAYGVSGLDIIWSGYDLDGYFEVGDIISIRYVI